MDEKHLKAINKVKEEIEKINNNENKIFFFVLDTKGTPSGSLEYIYKLAFNAKELGYNVGMLYQADKNDEFIGVEEWLGKDYSSLPHYNIASEEVGITPSDILFIPEIFANVMNQTKKLPCKRIAILQNYDFLIEQMPFAAQWGDFGILEAITNTEYNSELIKDIFPYVKTHVIPPYVDKMFGNTDEPKKMIINIVAKDQSDVNKIVKPFYWKYPAFKWVSFRDLRGFPKKNFANSLREAAVTIWADDDTSFGYTPLEAMKSGSIVIAKIPKSPLKWMNNKDEEEVGNLRNCCIWFDDFNLVHKAIANVVRSWITDKVPNVLYEEAEKVNEMYQKKDSVDELKKYLESVVSHRKREMEELVIEIEAKDKKSK